MGEEQNDGALTGLGRAPESIVAFYITQDAGPPSSIQGLGQTVGVINVRGPSGSPLQKPALKVTFPFEQSIEQPVGLVAFGWDRRCHFVLSAGDASEVHCKVWAQLNSGPDVWIIEDGSTHGTRVKDEESLQNGKIKIVHGRRQASKGLQSITIGSYIFSFRAPISDVELRQREDWFRHNPPIPVTSAMFDQQVGDDGYDLCRMDSSPIGEGGNAKVYRYMEKNTALFIAIKQEQTRTKEHKALVMKEISLMKSLRHPFLVDILFNDSDNNPLPMIFTAMPLYLGHLRSTLPLPDMPTTERVMLQIAEGLRFMHSNMILHRDLKPENILVASPGNIKIADYGWATSVKETTSLYGVCGTVSYCAPEAFNPNEIHTTALDVYSLGAIFLSMLDLGIVERGWVVREFHGRDEMFNTAFENVSKNPPNRYAGLVRSMLAPFPQGRCSLVECIDTVKAQRYEWTKRTPIIPLEMPTDLAAGQLRDQSTAKATRLQQTPFGVARATVKIPKLHLLARMPRPKNHQSPQQAPVKHGYNQWQPIAQKQEPRRPTPQAVPAQKLCDQAHVQGVNFNAGLQSYEKATVHNPFAVETRKGEKDKALFHHKHSANDKVLGNRTKESPIQRALLPAVCEATDEKGLKVKALSVARAAPLAGTRGRQPCNLRQIVRRSRQQAMKIHHARDAGVHKQVERRAARNKRVADLKKGAYDVAKGYFVIYRALFGLAYNGLAEGSERICRIFKDNACSRKALEHAAVLSLNDANAQLVASMHRHSLSATLSNRLTASAGQRPFKYYTDEEVLNSQLMLSRR